MTWDLVTAKAVTGVTGTASDVALARVMDEVLGTVEDLLGRGLLYKRDTVRFYNVSTRRVRLPRYPIDRILGVKNGRTHTIQHRVGWVEVEATTDKPLEITYAGGFKTLPSSLERALWEAFETLWGSSDPITGAPVSGGGGGTIVQGSGDISRIALPGGGSVSWDVGASVSGGSTGATSAAAQQARWGWLAPWAYILETFRSEASPVQTAFA